MGRLIGRAGATIKDIRSRSGAGVEIGEDEDRFVRDVHLYGNEEEREEAKRIINDTLGYSQDEPKEVNDKVVQYMH